MTPEQALLLLREHVEEREACCSTDDDRCADQDAWREIINTFQDLLDDYRWLQGERA